MSDSIRKIKLEENDILVLPDCFSPAYKILIKNEIDKVHPDKNIGIIYVPNPDNVRVIKTNG